MSLRSWLLFKPIENNFLHNVVSAGLIKGVQYSIQDYYAEASSRLLINYIFEHSKHPKCKDPFYFLNLLQRPSKNGGIIPWHEVITIDQTQRQLIANKFCYWSYLAGHTPERVQNDYGYTMLMFEPRLSDDSPISSNVKLPNYTFLRCLIGSASFWDIIKGYWYYLFAKTAPVHVFEDAHFKDLASKKFSKVVIQLHKNYTGPLNVIQHPKVTTLVISTTTQQYTIPVIKVDVTNKQFVCFTNPKPDIPWYLIDDAKSYYIK